MTRRPGAAIVSAMLALVAAIIGAFFAAFRPRASLVAENLALRQQLAALVRGRPRPRLGPIDRAFWGIGEDIEHPTHHLAALATKQRPDTSTLPAALEGLGETGRTYARLFAASSRSVQR